MKTYYVWRDRRTGVEVTVQLYELADALAKWRDDPSLDEFADMWMVERMATDPPVTRATRLEVS